MKLTSAKRIVIKVGSALMAERGTLRKEWLSALAEDIADLRKQGKEVIIVTSGAIALGRSVLGIPEKALKLEEKQAAAACGQITLAHAWQTALARYDLPIAQVLLTLEDSEDRRRYLNARETILTLLERGIIPVVNENDTVATSEIRFGDNDRLAARVAQMASADHLILLSDVDGLYTANPRKKGAAAHLAEVKQITPEIEKMAGGAGTASGSGGMITKIAAAKIALGAGCHMAIMHGAEPQPIRRLLHGERCTWFISSSTPTRARKKWIMGALHPAGKIVVDEGAAKALASGKSLLPAGVKKIEGTFEKGDPVLIQDESGHTLGKGLSGYSAEEARAIMGRKSEAIEGILGYKGRDTLIHRDDMVSE